MVSLRLRRQELPQRRSAQDLWSDYDRDFLGPLTPMLYNFWRPSESLVEGTWAPRVDIMEKPDEWIFKAEVPEVKPEDIGVSIEDGVLTIKGERKFEQETTEGGFTRIERQYGSFERSFSLPSGIDEGDVKAQYKDGVLTLNVKKKEEAKRKPVKIEVS